MSTFTDGAPPSVDPEPVEPDHCIRDDAEDAEADTGSIWLREEIQRRIAANNSASGGRHARRTPTPTPVTFGTADTPGYRPRHSTAAPGPDPVPPAPIGGPVRRPSGLPRRDQILAGSATPPPAWSGPPQSPPPPGSRPPGPAWPEAFRPESQPGTPQPGIPQPGTGIGAPSLPVRPALARPAPADGPPPAAPPSGPAAARLLAPPPQAGSPPVGARPALPPFSAVPPRPVSFPVGATAPPGAEPSVREAGQAVPAEYRQDLDDAPDRYRTTQPASTDEVLWSAAALPSAARAPATSPLAVPPVAVPEQRAPDDGTPSPQSAESDVSATGKRVRVVLAERKGVARPVRTVVDVQEGTAVGELLRSNLIGSQLTVALRFALGAGLALGVLPLLFSMFPEIGRVEILGLRLPWLILGVLVYPFLLGLGWWHTRTAERVEQDFADHVQD